MRALLVFAVLAAIASATDVECKNGGVAKTSAECDCPSYWEESDCSKIMCVNGGYAVPLDPASSEKNACYCPKGYYGTHCDAVKPSRPIGNEFETKKTFNLYIHNELTDWYGKKALQRIKNTTSAILKDYDFDNFNLYESQRGATMIKKNPTVSLSTFITALSEMEEKTTTKYSCEPAPTISYTELHKSLEENNIEDSVILMFTQYPPTADADSLEELKKYLRAFRIKLNVLIGADDILLDCNSKKNSEKGLFDELIDLAHFTDGEVATFLIEDDDSPDELLPAFIRSSALPQSHSRAASEDCNGLALKFQTDPYPNTYYIAVRSKQGAPATVTGTCSSGGQLSVSSPSFYGEFTLYSILSGAQQNCTLSVTTEKSGCLATVFSVGGEKDVDSFELFHSFSTTDDMDTDSIHAFKDEDFFLSLHIKVSDKPKYPIVNFTGVVVINNEDEQQIFEKNLVQRSPAVFEYISSEAFTCPANSSSWIQLKLEGLNVKGETLAVLDRMIPLNCEGHAGPSVVSHLLRAEATTSAQKPILAVLFSNRLTAAQFSKFILPTTDKSMEERFSQFGYLRFDAANSMNFQLTDFSQFNTHVYDNAPDSTINNQENLMSNLEKLTASVSSSITSDSLVSIAIQHSMSKASSYASNLAALANMGAKLVFWGDTNTVKTPEVTDTLEKFIRLAAVSAGHVILIDSKEFDDDDDFYMSLALRDMYSSGPSQRLLAFSNLEWEPLSTTTQSNSVGVVQVPEGVATIFVSITLNIADPSKIIDPFMVSLVLSGDDRIVLNLQDFTSYGPTSNLFTAKIPVTESTIYDASITILAMTSFSGAHIRFWVDRAEEIIPTLKYVDFNMGSVQPDDYLGAALNVLETSGSDTIALRVIAQDGTQAKRLDSNQTAAIIGGVAHFVPYFCDSEQNDYLSKDTYTMEITYEGGFKYFRPMVCTKTGKVEDKCTPDKDGNYYCEESNPPFHRGPSKKLVDCSGVGDVAYSTDADAVDNYKCTCLTGFAGQSCEQSSCAEGIEHLPIEQDASFRTLSFVFIGPSGTDVCTEMNSFYTKQAKDLFKKDSKYENIQQYTFSVYFTDGTAKTLYRGASFDKFYSQFDVLTADDLDVVNFCGDEKQTRPDLNMNEIFTLAAESVGRVSRGIILLHASQSFYDHIEYGQLRNIVLDNDFYQSVQAYQQHIYMVTPIITKDIIALTTASGGVAVTIVDDWDNNYKTNKDKFQIVFDNIIKSQIGWAGVLTEATEEKKWTITQDAEVFYLSGQDDGSTLAKPLELPKLKDCAGNDFPGMEPLPSDSMEENRQVSQHVSIDGSAGSQCLSISYDASDSNYTLVQVVILTKEKPTLHALIGQGQANADKHSAGATSTSEKAAHISFNKLSSAFKFEPVDINWRQASRINCSFAQEFVAALKQPFDEIGPSIVDFTASPVDNNGEIDENKKSSLSVPIVVTETIDCGSHGTFSSYGSFCECEENYSGPTCSQPRCGKGKLNTHGDHCDCTDAAAGGPFCRG